MSGATTLTIETPALENTAFALLRGEPLHKIPLDLYIRPAAMNVFLATFSGPMDLLLYLIKHNNIDILDIPVADISQQYMNYVELMQTLCLELAADYLIMAATLTEIKSRMLLPQPVSLELDSDPRAELARRLQEYEQFKLAAEKLEQLPRLERDNFTAHAKKPDVSVEKSVAEVDLYELILAFKGILQRVNVSTQHFIQRESLSVRERMTLILSALNDNEFIPFLSFFSASEGRQGLVVTLLASLELIRESLIELAQAKPFSPIYLKKKK